MSHDEGGGLNSPTEASRAREGSAVYLGAAGLPAWLFLSAMFSPFEAHGISHWFALATVVACVAQLFWPAQVLRVSAFSWYAVASAQVLWEQVGVIQDYITYGGEEHTRWEGWQTEWEFLGFAVFLMAVSCLLARNIWRRRANAT